MELLWNRHLACCYKYGVIVEQASGLLLKKLSYGGTGILPVAKKVELLWNRHLACC
jgi:hypothetical protein